MQNEKNEFLKINQDDGEDLIKIKQAAQKAIDNNDFENLSFIKLISANSIVESLKSDLDFNRDKEKVKLLSDFLHSVHQSYRDAIVYDAIDSVVELVHASPSREHILDALSTGMGIIKDKILHTANKEKDLALKMEEVFPELLEMKK